MEVKQKVSLCPECTACPEVEVLHLNPTLRGEDLEAFTRSYSRSDCR